jgi:hypothetical protein
LVEIATAVSVIHILIHFGGHFEHDQAGRVVAGGASGAIIGCTEGTGEAEIQCCTNEPTEAAVDLTLSGERKGMRGEVRVRQPTARGFGKWRGEGVSVVLIADLGLSDKGVEIKSRESLVRKR